MTRWVITCDTWHVSCDVSRPWSWRPPSPRTPAASPSPSTSTSSWSPTRGRPTLTRPRCSTCSGGGRGCILMSLNQCLNSQKPRHWRQWVCSWGGSQKVDDRKSRNYKWGHRGDDRGVQKVGCEDKEVKWKHFWRRHFLPRLSKTIFYMHVKLIIFLSDFVAMLQSWLLTCKSFGRTNYVDILINLLSLPCKTLIIKCPTLIFQSTTNETDRVWHERHSYSVST